MEEISSSDDGLLVYWTGHCRLARDGSLQLALTPGSRGAPAHWLPAYDLARAMTRSGSRDQDRLLILDTCLASDDPGNEPYSTRVVRREIDRLSRAGVAVLSSVGASPLGFAVNSHAPSVFTQQLALLLRSSPVAHHEAMALPGLHRLLAASLRSSGYLRPMLRNAKRFQRPLAASIQTKRAAGPGEGLPTRRHAAMELALSRYALAVAGSPRARAKDTSSHQFYDPAADAATVYDALLGSHCGFTSRSTSLLSDPPSRHGLLSAVEDLTEQGQNLVLLYMAGHGTVRSSGRKLDLAVYLADDETVLVSDLVNDLRKTHAERVVMMLDVCSVNPSTALSRLTPGFLHSEQRPGFSRLMVEWLNTASQRRRSQESGLETRGQQDNCLVRWGPEWALDTAMRETPQWLFDFPGAAIRCLDDSGPMEHWMRLLRNSTGLLPRPGSILSSIWDSPLSDEPGWTSPGPDLEERPVRQSTVPQTRGRTSRADAPAAVPAAPPAATRTASEGGAPRRTVHRRHRAQLRVADGSLPLRVGRHFRVTFNYQPLDEEWRVRPGVDASETSPLDITLRIGAGSAKVNPSVIHTRLTDDSGTPPEDFRITPRSQDPVTLRIDVVRSADGAVIQQIKSVLAVSGGDGADH
ncbi:caspase family protein [Streptomyces lunaelactis]|uniref:caspase family protein n=1 Tax=Streptomyces lunaelactis TaxID=1535768 RepID=UPI00158574A1|nr:caspase family protein [Streptomyces lunaelactis]NUK87287.1 caspase family protein [Streptomyces lunaelactis]